MAGHLVPLGSTGWAVWRDVLLRGTGFPADGLDALAAAECAEAADAHLADVGDPVAAERFAKTLAEAASATSAELCRIAADPLFREAVTWQNTNALVALDGLVAGGPTAPRNVRRRERESLVARYWQRYCAKNETVGFFGPVLWGTLDPAVAAVTVRPGPGLVRSRRVYCEHWMLSAYADRLAEDPATRRWFSPALPPHLRLTGRSVRHPAQPPTGLSTVEAVALARCDGRRPAVDVVAGLVADPALGVRRDDDGYLLLTRLAERGLLRWGADLPQHPDAEHVLRQRLAAIGDPPVRAAALAGLDRLGAARDRVAGAAGDPTGLEAALADLAAVFTSLTGVAPHRRPGQMYAGRSLCYEETVRDADLVVGRVLLDAVAAPLGLLCQAARWLSRALADAYRAALRELHSELSAGGAEVRLGELWYLAQGMLFGAGDTGGVRPVDTVAAEFAGRWARVFGLADAPPGTRSLRYTAAALAARVAAEFAAEHAGWAAGRLHSPDLQICAADPEAVRRGDFTVVLGELHAAWATFDSAVFTQAHPDPASLRQALAEDLGGGRVRPLYPVDWPRYTGRVAHTLDGPTDVQLGFADAPGADPDRLLPVTAAVVSDVDGASVVRAPDGRCWPLLEVFSALVAMHAVDGFKLVAAAPHTPRITVDAMVVARETWRTTVGGTGLAGVVGEPARYLAARRWRAALGLPERVFVKVATETKPCYVDLTSPPYVMVLCTLLRGARSSGGDAVPVVVSEMLPTPDQAWLPDRAGNRYHSELRLQVCDPAGARR